MARTEVSVLRSSTTCPASGGDNEQGRETGAERSMLVVLAKTMTEGKEYCERKINLLKSNFDELVEASQETHKWFEGSFTKSQNFLLPNVKAIIDGYEEEKHSRRNGSASTSQAEAVIAEPEFMRPDRTSCLHLVRWPGKLKDLGNSVLGRFGMSVDNFKAVKDPNTGSYSISFQQ
ncbi:hypothetical protein OsI_34106 [Oryza sativa Indica Group]|uniref:Uncharacterized protein n=1 Tax=Oryza sativa subsp. indica TaxID=39946 RepID=A2Z8R3_ORYSI|nr:hypothetical protein OsI_34106 [Oryza sativa Indica Group]